jgi:hypothetical protein
MTMETLASVHVFITSNLHIFVNCLVTYRVSTCLTICHTSKAVLSGVRQMLFWSCTKLCKSQHFLHYKCLGEIARNHSGLNHSSGLRPSVQAPSWLRLWCNTAYLIHHKPYGSAPGSYASRQHEILIIALALFGGKSSWDVCQIHGNTYTTKLRF